MKKTNCFSGKLYFYYDNSWNFLVFIVSKRYSLYIIYLCCAYYIPSDGVQASNAFSVELLVSIVKLEMLIVCTKPNICLLSNVLQIGVSIM